MAKDKEEPAEETPVVPAPVVPAGAVLLYETDGRRVYQVGNATGDGSEGNAPQRIVVNVREVEEV